MKLADLTQTEYANVEERKVGKTTKGDNYSTLKKVMNAYKLWFFDFVQKERLPPKTENLEFWDIAAYHVAWGMITASCKRYSLSDITQTSIAIKEYEQERSFNHSGIFLASLINCHFEKTQTIEEYILVTEQYEKPIDEIGFLNNGANIKIIGNAGDYLGEYMKQGKIIVQGNAERDVGSNMEGGEIHLRNAKEGLGYLQLGGMIFVSENAGEDVGEHMYGGEIFLVQEPTTITLLTEGGNIYYKGTLIREKE